MQTLDNNSIICGIGSGAHVNGEARARAFARIEAEMDGERLSGRGSTSRIMWTAALFLLVAGMTLLLTGAPALDFAQILGDETTLVRRAGLPFADSGLVVFLLASGVAYIGLIGALSLRLPMSARRGIIRAAVGKAAWFHIIVLPLLAAGREISAPAVAAVFAILVLVDHIVLPIGNTSGSEAGMGGRKVHSAQ